MSVTAQRVYAAHMEMLNKVIQACTEQREAKRLTDVTLGAAAVLLDSS